MTKAIAQPSGGAVGEPEPEPRGSTRELLLSAAATAIARSGWGAVTTRQVASLAGVNQGLVHYHFGSMEQLRREATLFVLAQETAGPVQALLAPGPFAERLDEGLTMIGALDPRSESALVLYEAMLAATRDGELGALLAEALGDFRRQLADRIDQAGGRHPVEAAAMVTAVLDGILLHRAVDRQLDPVALATPLLAALELEEPVP